jgi:hypothetical protein
MGLYALTNEKYGMGRTRLGLKHVRSVGLGLAFAVYVRKYKINSEKSRSAFFFCFPCILILGGYVLQAQTFAALRAVVDETARAIATPNLWSLARAPALAVAAAVVFLARV